MTMSQRVGDLELSQLTVVMLLDNHYPPDGRVEYESTLLCSSGMKVRIIAWDRRDFGQPATEIDEVAEPLGTSEHSAEVIRVRAPAPAGGGRKALQGLLRFCRLVWRDRFHLFSDADIIIVHDFYLLPFARLLHATTGLPFIYDAHEEYAAMEGDRLPGWWLNFATRLETHLARPGEAVVVPGRTRIPRWSTTGVSRLLIVRNLGTGTGNQPSKETDWDIVCVTGILAPKRRADLLLEVARRRPDLRIALAGVGRSAEEIEKAAESLPNFDFIGWTDDPDGLLARIVQQAA